MNFIPHLFKCHLRCASSVVAGFSCLSWSIQNMESQKFGVHLITFSRKLPHSLSKPFLPFSLSWDGMSRRFFPQWQTMEQSKITISSKKKLHISNILLPVTRLRYTLYFSEFKFKIPGILSNFWLQMHFLSLSAFDCCRVNRQITRPFLNY